METGSRWPKRGDSWRYASTAERTPVGVAGSAAMRESAKDDNNPNAMTRSIQRDFVARP